MKTRKKPPAPKPLKAWAFVSPSGEYIGIRYQAEEEVWILAYDAYRQTKTLPRRTFSQAKKYLKEAGYRAVRVLITPCKP